MLTARTAPHIYAASARSGGNSDTAASLMARAIAEADPRYADGLPVHHLREYSIRNCAACGRCSFKPESGCSLDARGEPDDARRLLAPLHAAPYVVFCSPIYFYHVPGLFKSLMDRSQADYEKWMAKDPALRELPKRRAYVILNAGRPTGDKLFEGALITLKFFLITYNIELAEPLLLRGLDARGDLSDDEATVECVLEYGRAAARYERQHGPQATD